MANIFVKQVKESDISQKLSIPTEFVINNHLTNLVGAPLMVTDVDTEGVFLFVLSTRSGRHLKPVFQAKGWLKYARDRHLQIGDIIQFWIEPVQGLFKIQVVHRKSA